MVCLALHCSLLDPDYVYNATHKARMTKHKESAAQFDATDYQGVLHDATHEHTTDTDDFGSCNTMSYQTDF
jgi:hypothetical protein